MVSYTKRQLIDHIHRLTAKQLKQTGSVEARCVLRDGRIELIPYQRTKATDLVIIDHVRSPDTVPLRTVIHKGVDEHWDTLNDLHINVPVDLWTKESP